MHHLPGPCILLIFHASASSLMRPLFVLTIAFCSLVFGGCSTPLSRTREIPTGRTEYQLFFVQRSNHQYPRQAHYRLVDRNSGRTLATFASQIKVDERGVDNRPLRIGRDFTPLVVVSPSGQTLLITEDCWDAVPENGYLLVKLRGEKPPESAYLRMPRGRSDPPNPYGWQAKVRALDDQDVRVDYQRGQRTFSLQQLQSASSRLRAP
jgi:hypothetical protein